MIYMKKRSSMNRNQYLLKLKQIESSKYSTLTLNRYTFRFFILLAREIFMFYKVSVTASRFFFVIALKKPSKWITLSIITLKYTKHHYWTLPRIHMINISDFLILISGKFMYLPHPPMYDPDKTLSKWCPGTCKHLFVI